MKIFFVSEDTDRPTGEIIFAENAEDAAKFYNEYHDRQYEEYKVEYPFVKVGDREDWVPIIGPEQIKEVGEFKGAGTMISVGKHGELYGDLSKLTK